MDRTLTLEASGDNGTTWVGVNARKTGTQYVGSTIAGNAALVADAAGFSQMRLRATATWTGTANITFTTAGPATGTNFIGSDRKRSSFVSVLNASFTLSGDSAKYTIPAGSKIYRIKHAQCYLTADSTAGTRRISFFIWDGSNNVIFQSPAPAGQPASTAWGYIATATGGVATGTSAYALLLPDVPLPSGYTIGFGLTTYGSTTGDSGDAFSACVAGFEDES